MQSKAFDKSVIRAPNALPLSIVSLNFYVLTEDCVEYIPDEIHSE